MATSITKDTFISTYKDDYRDSDNYHRILFNPGRSLQARELTQSQTIINKEIERIGRYLFKEGSIITSSLGGLDAKEFAVPFVKLDTTTNTLPTNYNDLIGTNITNDIGSPVTARVKAVIPAEGADPATLLIDYVDGGDNDIINSTTPQIFQAGQDLTTTLGTLTIQSTDTVANPATGFGSAITVPQNEAFAAGHFVYIPAQTLVLSKYSSNPNVTVGYVVNETVVTVADDFALYDNAGANPNLSAPGADRYRIRLVLTKQADAAATDTFIPVIKIVDGRAVLVQNQDNILNRLGTTLARRTSEESGNYIVRGNNTFGLQVLQDSDDDYLRYVIQPGTAYVNGFRISKTLPTNNLRVQKPRRDPEDIVTVTGENVAANYGNYFLADSMYGLVSKMTIVEDGAGVESTINLYDSVGINGTIVGTANVRSIDKVDTQYRIHMFNINMDSTGSGVPYSIGVTRSIGTDSNNYANIVLEGSTAQVYKPAENTLLFPLDREYPQDLTGISMTVGEVFTGTTNGAGELIINTSSVTEEFADEDQWILAYDSAGEVVTSLTIDSGGAGTPQVKISGLQASKNVHLLSYVNIAATVKAKSLVSDAQESISLTNGVGTLSKTDVDVINSIVDDTTGEDITYKFTFNYRVTDNYYDVPTITVSRGYSAPAGTVTVTYDYFSHGSGDLFAVNSYNGVNYKNIQSYLIRSNGLQYNLRQLIDLRFVKNTSGSGFTGTGSFIPRIPRNRDIITINAVDYYQGRIDKIYMTPNGSIQVAEGQSGSPAEAPVIPRDAMVLHTVELQPYAVDLKNVFQYSTNNFGYQMRDIRKLEGRISNLEDITTLTIGELNTSRIAVVDENGLERTKIGLTSDAFKDFSQTYNIAITLEERAALDLVEQSLRPMTVRRQLALNYDSDASSGVELYSKTVWPKFTEEVLINQNTASGSINVNQFGLSKFIGSASIIPSGDTWTVRRTVQTGVGVRAGTTPKVSINGNLSYYETGFVDYGNDQ